MSQCEHLLRSGGGRFPVPACSTRGSLQLATFPTPPLPCPLSLSSAPINNHQLSAVGPPPPPHLSISARPACRTGSTIFPFTSLPSPSVRLVLFFASPNSRR